MSRCPLHLLSLLWHLQLPHLRLLLPVQGGQSGVLPGQRLPGIRDPLHVVRAGGGHRPCTAADCTPPVTHAVLDVASQALPTAPAVWPSAHKVRDGPVSLHPRTLLLLPLLARVAAGWKSGTILGDQLCPLPAERKLLLQPPSDDWRQERILKVWETAAAAAAAVGTPHERAAARAAARAKEDVDLMGGRPLVCIFPVDPGVSAGF